MFSLAEPSRVLTIFQIGLAPPEDALDDEHPLGELAEQNDDGDGAYDDPAEPFDWRKLIELPPVPQEREAPLPALFAALGCSCRRIGKLGNRGRLVP